MQSWIRMALCRHRLCDAGGEGSSYMRRFINNSYENFVETSSTYHLT